MFKEETSFATILVLMDGSPASQAASTVAIQLAQKEPLTVRGLYIIDEGLILDGFANFHGELAHTGDPESREELVSWFQEQGDAALRWLEIKCHIEDVPVETDVMFGGVPEITLHQEEKAALLALGRRGLRQAEDPSKLGHNFRKITHQGHIPLLVGGHEHHPIQNILLAREINEQAQTALRWTARLQHSLSASLTILTPFECGKDPVQLKRLLARGGIDNYHLLYSEGVTADDISAAAVSCQADLIVMEGYEHGALMTKFFGSTLEEVLKQISLPVLVA
ncbi:MAG: universal stress protein [Candidatus Promineifilaceae bacterium]